MFLPAGARDVPRRGAWGRPLDRRLGLTVTGNQPPRLPLADEVGRQYQEGKCVPSTSLSIGARCIMSIPCGTLPSEVMPSVRKDSLDNRTSDQWSNVRREGSTLANAIPSRAKRQTLNRPTPQIHDGRAEAGYRGVNLGGWLVLESWIYPQWWDQVRSASPRTQMTRCCIQPP
jgi:hypothetical protein